MEEAPEASIHYIRILYVLVALGFPRVGIMAGVTENSPRVLKKLYATKEASPLLFSALLLLV